MTKAILIAGLQFLGLIAIGVVIYCVVVGLMLL